VLILEARAQISGILGFVTTDKKPSDSLIHYFAGSDKVRFKRPVVPGDKLVLTSEIDAVKRNIWRFKTTATVDGKTASAAVLLCAYQDRDTLA
jgi:3-hydroxyacyl-[acyl-carrier-protein] dehydratase